MIEEDADWVAERGSPEISPARVAGVTAIVEPTAVSVGRRANMLRAVSVTTGCRSWRQPGTIGSPKHHFGRTRPALIGYESR